MTVLIAEDLLLLLINDETGKLRISNTQPVIGGALLAELALDGAVKLSGKRRFGLRPKVEVNPGITLDDRVLQLALEKVAAKKQKPANLINRLGKEALPVLTQRLIDRKILKKQERSLLGLVYSTRWPEVDPLPEKELRSRLHSVLVNGTDPDPRTAAVIALLSSTEQAHKIIKDPVVTPKEIKKRAKKIAESNWAAKAIRDLFNEIDIVMIASVAATTASYSSSN